MPKHFISVRKKPKAEIKAAPTWYERTHPVGSAERFLDEAAKDALEMAAAGGVPGPKQVIASAAKEVLKDMRYPDPLLAEAAKLPREELMKRAARADAFQRYMDSQNRAVALAAALDSPLGKTATAVAGAELSDRLQTQQDAQGGDSVSENPGPVSENPRPVSGGPRIVINPTTFRNKKDALCVAFNEGFRLWMEATGFEPQSEPTDAQRRFFSDTAYADDEVQLRRTILARIATFDTSVKDPTDDQLAETGAFLDAILESDWCKNEWERNCVSRLSQAVKASVGAEPVEPKQEPLEPREPEPLQSRAALGGGETDEEELAKKATSSALAGPANMQPDDSVEQQQQEPTAGAGPEYQTPATQQEQPGQEPTQEPENPGQPEEPAPQDAQGAVQPGNEQAQPQNAPQGQEEPSRPERQGAWSDVWTGGEAGKGRQLTAREAEWMRKRIDSGASVSGQQLAMFGLSRNEEGGLVNKDGSAFQGFGGGQAESAKPADAGLDRKDDRRKRRRGSTVLA